MEHNYTPLDLNKFNNNKTTTFLLLLATITLAILAVVLFLFIQRRIKDNNQSNFQIPPTQENLTIPTPTIINNEFFPSPLPIATEESTFVNSTPSPTEIIINQNNEILLPASPSPTAIINPTGSNPSEWQ